MLGSPLLSRLALVVALVLVLPGVVAAAERSSGDIERDLDDSRSRAQRVEAGLADLRDDVGAERAQLVAIEQRLEDARGRLRQAEGQVALGEAALDDARERERLAEANLAEALELLAETDSELAEQEDVLTDQVAATYMYGSANQAAVALAMIREAREPGELARSVHRLGTVLDAQEQVIDEVIELRAQRVALRDDASQARQQAVDRRADAADTVAEVEDLRAQARAVADEVADEERKQRDVVATLESDADAREALLREVRARSDELSASLAAAEERDRERERQQAQEAAAEVRPTISGSRCPVVGAMAGRDFSDDWGYPRPGGRRHEGTDIFAERGTPVVAVADGIVRDVSRVDSGLGGRTVSYDVGNGSYWYIAHLDSVAADIGPGSAISAGQQIGTVGNSGNARTTPPHAHVGHYTGAGDAVNPYPTLEPAC